MQHQKYFFRSKFFLAFFQCTLIISEQLKDIMDYIKQYEQKFCVIGITGRTTNEKELAGKGIIGQLWQQFFTQSILSKIPNKIDNDIIVCYYNYESDHKSEYSYLIGARVSTTETIPTDMVALCVPSGKYAIFTTNKGALVPESVKTWQHIWALEDQKTLPRLYNIDFEIHDERSHDQNNGQIEIHLGLK